MKKSKKPVVDSFIKWTALADIAALILLIIVLLCARTCNRDTSIEDVSNESNDAVEQADEVGNTGDLKITLMWDFQGDIDLHVLEPNRNEIYYHNPKDNSTGGYLDVDNINGGNGSAENVYWTNPPRGKYVVALFYYQPSRSSGIAGSGYCTVVIQQKGKPAKTYSVAMSSVKEKKIVTTVMVE